MNWKLIRNIDVNMISFFKTVSEPISRFGLFLVFFWFGLLKVFDLSPASPLVGDLFHRTFPIDIGFGTFMVLFGLFEALIGILFLIKGVERLVIPLLAVHMITTFLPLILLPEIAWSGFLVPTLEGQYIIKNIVIISTAIGIMAHLHPIRNK